MFDRIYYFLRIAREKTYPGTFNGEFLLLNAAIRILIVLDNVCRRSFQNNVLQLCAASLWHLVMLLVALNSHYITAMRNNVINEFINQANLL